MKNILKLTTFCSILVINLSTDLDNINSKNSIGGLVGSPNDANFRKSFFLLVDTFQHIVYGHENEVYNFTYWFGNVTCPKDPLDKCDVRMCGGVPGAEAYCEISKPEEPSICKCKFPSTYPQKCGQPKLVLEAKNYYYGLDGSPETETFVTTTTFMAACGMFAGDKLPVTPRPVIKVSQDDLANGNAGLRVTISITQYVQVQGLPVYFWTVQTISIQINKTSLALVLEKMAGKEHLFKMLKDLKLYQNSVK